MSITRIKSALTISIVITALLLACVADLQAASSGCSNLPIDVVNEVCWDCLYPMKLGGVTILDGSLPDSTPEGLQQSAICQCPTTAYPWVRIGLSFTFWEPAQADRDGQNSILLSRNRLSAEQPESGSTSGVHAKKQRHVPRHDVRPGTLLCLRDHGLCLKCHLVQMRQREQRRQLVRSCVHDGAGRLMER